MSLSGATFGPLSRPELPTQVPGMSPTLSTLGPLSLATSASDSLSKRRVESQICRSSARRLGGLTDLRASRISLVNSFEAGDSDDEDAAILASIVADDDE